MSPLISLKNKKAKVKNCVVCNKLIHRGSRTTKRKERRGVNCVTCSKTCSKIYNRGKKYPKKKKIIIKEKIKEK